MIYTAILRRNFRDVQTLKPNVLLTEVKDLNGNLYREDGHCHIQKKYVQDVLPIETSTMLSYAIITFEAEECEYIKKGDIKNTTLRNVKIINVKYINKKKPKMLSTRKQKTRKPKKASKTIKV